MNIYIYQLEECSCGAWKSASQWHKLWHDSRVRTIIRSHSDVVWRNFVPNHFQITDTHNKNVLLFLSVGEGLFFIPTLLVLIVWRNWFWFSSLHTHNWLANIVILSFHAFFGNICCFLIEQCNKSPIHQTLPHIQLPDDPAKKREKKKNLWIDPEMTHDFSRIRKLTFSFWLFDFEFHTISIGLTDHVVSIGINRFSSIIRLSITP